MQTYAIPLKKMQSWSKAINSTKGFVDSKFTCFPIPRDHIEFFGQVDAPIVLM